jgi:hypothetical protein
MLTQLARIPKGDTIEEDHQRDRQLIGRYIMDKTTLVLNGFEKVKKSPPIIVSASDRLLAEPFDR